MENNEMTGRDMLEFAAKAVGITLKPMEVKNVEFMGDDHFIGFMTDPSEWKRGWFDPLNDDGDALRLAAVLSMRVDFCGKTGCAARYGVDCENVIYVLFDANRDLLMASRLAITKAAAEIGKRMTQFSSFT